MFTTSRNQLDSIPDSPNNPFGGAYEAWAYSDKIAVKHCAKGTNGPESEPEEGNYFS